MSIGVFISHSTWHKAGLQDLSPSHPAFLHKLCERLSGERGIDVVVDDSIPIGRNWREFLFDKIAECRAAIVLVNEQALHHSPWVDTEVKVFAYRAYTEQDEFCLILVPFGGITAASIDGHSPWAPVAVGRLQMLPRDGLDPDDDSAVDGVIEKIVGVLKELPDLAPDRSPSAWLVTRLCGLLQMEPGSLTEIGDRLGADTAGIQNTSVARRRVAHSLYSKGPSGLLELLRCPSCRLSTGELIQILDILGTYWIDMAASVGLLSCRRELGANRVIAINGREFGHTPRAYVRQVCGVSHPWPVIPVDLRGDVVDQIRDELISLFEKQLRSRFPRLHLATPDEITLELNRILSLDRAVPVFVTFLQEGGGQMDDLITAVHAEFPEIRLVACTGTEPNRAILTPGIPMLMPEISLEREARAYEEYIGVETHLRGEN